MTTPLLEHIGKRIRLYRNAKNINMETLSRLIHKSKATESKYERGQIAIDINTLFEIAHVLQIDINQLIDFQFPGRPQRDALLSNPFEANILYMYIFDGRVNRLVKSAIEVHDNAFPPKLTVTLYYNIESYDEYSNCEYLYFGVMRPFDTIVNLLLENQSNPIEQVLINVVRPFKKTNVWAGLMSGLSYIHISPIVNKVIISRAIMPHDEKLDELLVISKDEFKMMKKQNAFIV
jgi:transcriptional regulator with XRE-family HTH domain